MALSSSPTHVVSNLNGTVGLAVDSVLQRIWWTRASGLVESADFDGLQRAILHDGGIPLTSIDVFEDFVYTWVPSIGKLLKVNKFARHGETPLCTTQSGQTRLVMCTACSTQ